MTNNDLNQIDELLKRRLAESEQRLKEEMATSDNRVMAETGKFIEDEILTVLDSHTKILNSHTATLNSHTTALKQILTNDEHHKDDIIKLDKRVHKLEDQAGIVPPSELTVIR